MAPQPISKAPVAFVAPAIDGFNAKADFLGGAASGRGLFEARGALSIPLPLPAYGLQIDAITGSWSGSGYGQVAGHLFWRDPSVGLVGVYATHAHLERYGGVGATQVAFEGEYYWNRWTLQGLAGYETGGATSQIVGAEILGYDVKSRFFDKVNLAYYLTDNTKLYAGHRYEGGKNALALGGEWAFGLAPGVSTSAFLEGRLGEARFNGIWAGLRVYLGEKDKTLIQRHRQDDPPIYDTLFTILNSLTRGAVPPPVPPPPPPCFGDGCFLGPG